MSWMQRAASRADSIVADTLVLVSVESPSEDLAALERSADTVTALIEAHLHVQPERIVVEGRPHLRVVWGDAPPKVLLLAHHDTVWPLDTLDRLPAMCEDGVLRGPGVLDMKSGLVIGLHALAMLREAGGDAALDGISLLVTADEELGSATSRALIEGSGVRSALVLEAGGPGGEIKTARKGVSMYRLDIQGRAAHAGSEPEKGINATVALAHAVLALTELADVDAGTSVSPTLAASGTTINTLAASASISVDVRAWTAAEQRRVDDAIRALQSPLAGATISVHGGINRAPLERDMSAELFEIAQQVAADIGHPPLVSGAVGGGSDGNFTAGAGIRTLDGLGAVGGGAHADTEFALESSLAPRAALLAGMLERLAAE